MLRFIQSFVEWLNYFPASAIRIRFCSVELHFTVAAAAAGAAVDDDDDYMYLDVYITLRKPLSFISFWFLIRTQFQVLI